MKYIPYGRQCIDKDDIKEVVKVLKSDWLTQGPMVQRFEEVLARYCGAKYVVAVSSGTAALHLACLVAGLKKGDEAITSPITFLATPNAVLYAAAKPVFADIDHDTVNISAGEIGKNITKKTKVILPVHFAGLPCDMPEIAKIAGKHNLVVIEDACHALGAEYKTNGKWIKVGSCKHSDMTIFSFHPVKSITTGEGGAITTNNKELYERLIILRNHGVTKDHARLTNLYSSLFPKGAWYYEMQYLGFNYRITDMQCAIGISQLKRIGAFLNRRKEIADIYSRKISNINEIEAPFEENNVRSAWHLYVIRIRKNRDLKSDRNELFSYLRKAGIGVQLHYIPVYLQPYYYKLGYKKRICPQAEEYYQTALSLPVYPMLTNKDIKYITTKISKFFC